MAKTSIHIKAALGSCTKHNRREKELKHVRSEFSHLNEYWEGDDYGRRLASIKERYFKTVGQKMQSKATPIREGVVVIQDSTTMDDLRKLADAFKARLGLEVFQIAIHRDEGHDKKGKEWKPNLHAHLVFDWTDKQTGKTLKLTKEQIAETQSICAEVLGMERGHSSEKKHLSALQYKVFAKNQEVEELEELEKDISQKVDAKVREKEVLDKQTGIVAKVAAAFNVGPEAAIRKENEQLRAEKEAAEAARKAVIAKANQIITQERENARAAEKKAKEAGDKLNTTRKENERLSATLTSLQNQLKPHKPMQDILVGDTITFKEHEEYKDEWVATWRGYTVASARIKKDGSVDITEWHPDQESHSYDHASSLQEAWRRIYSYAWGEFEPELKQHLGQGRGFGF